MFVLADGSYDMMIEVAKGTALVLGGGTIAKLLEVYFGNKSGEKKDEISRLSTRVTQMETAHRDCEGKWLECEKMKMRQSLDLERLRDQIMDIEGELVTAVIRTNSSMCIVRWNTGAALMFGYTEEEVLGQDVEFLVPGYLKQPHRDAFMAAINNYDKVVDSERTAVALHKSGREIPIHLKLNSFNLKASEKFFEARITKAREPHDNHA